MKSFLLLLILAPCLAYSQWPDRMEYDLQNDPFLHGVASGDPLKDRVIIWSRITPPAGYTGPLNVNWEVAIDSNFYQVVESGQFQTSDSIDWTIKVDVTNLQSNFTYWYRFSDDNGFYSAKGRTRTASDGLNNQHMRFGVCYGTSLYSGYLNAYKFLAQREDLSGVIHMGDYIYEFVDSDEHVRVPSSFPFFEGGVQSVDSINEWRYIHNLYHMDIDFRAALEMHPFMIIWDNHDIIRGGDTESSIKAFLEWTPTRMPDQADSMRLFRKLEYGNFLDIHMVDMWNYKDMDTPNEMLGNYQNSWLKNSLQQSTSRWHILAEQKPMGGWDLIAGLPYNQSNTWDGYSSERDAFYQFLNTFNINNTIVLSGDAHVTIGMNLEHQGDPVGVELMPASVTRGNFDEMGYGFAAGVAEAQSMLVNSHHVYSNFVDQGYALLDLSMTNAIAEIWYCDILNPTSNQNLGKALQTIYGSNQWGNQFNTASNSIPNQLPYDISVTNLSVGEHAPQGSLIGTLTAFDNNSADTHQFGLSDNANGRFLIDSNGLYVNNSALLDYESNTSHSITIFTVDNKGGYYEETFVVNVTDQNDLPTDLMLSDTLFDGNLPVGTSVSFASVVDEDNNDNHTYELVSGPGSDDNYQFIVNGDAIGLGINFQNADTIYNIRLKVTDSGNETYEEAFVLYNLNALAISGISNHRMKLFPNPAHSSFVFQFSNEFSGQLKFNIYNAKGALVSSMEYAKSSRYFKREINVESLRAGNYVLEIVGESLKESLPFVVE